MTAKQSQFYLRGGVEYTRCTTILSYFKDPQLLKWMLKIGKDEAKEIGRKAMAIGTNVDNAICNDTLGKKVGKFKTVEEENCYEAYKQWCKDYQIKDLKSAETLYDDENKVAGTPDLWLPNETCDIKCSTAIRPTYWLQVNWYARQKRHTHCSILRLDKSLAIYDYKKILVSDYLTQAFDAALTLYRYYNKSVTDGEEG